MIKRYNTIIFTLLYLSLNAQQAALPKNLELPFFAQQTMFSDYPIFGDEEKVKTWLKTYVNDTIFRSNGTVLENGYFCYKFKVCANQNFHGQSLNSTDSYFLLGVNEDEPQRLAYLFYQLDFKNSEARP